ncbi:hypothetical protein DPX16_18915 [Anabarilius grahami]|uniref:Uncharacterized protein n=1 Tax=Anabarilius grahami TaxID=495550 RepID=A0A3N0YLR6_ANAGA|nr:hypothetical protein DPX16_18915 [Anabarilius grahami]
MEYPDDLLYLPESTKYYSSTLKSVWKLCLEWHTKGRNTPGLRRRTSGDESRLRGWLTSAATGSTESVLRLRKMKCQQVAVAEQPIRMIRWPNRPTSSDANSTCRNGRKKADKDQLQPTVRNTLRKLSRPTNKNCPAADRQLDMKGEENVFLRHVSQRERLPQRMHWCILAHDSSVSLLTPHSSPPRGAIRELRCPSRWLSLIGFRVIGWRTEERGNEEGY